MSTEGATGELALQSQQRALFRPVVALWGFARRKPLGAAGLAILAFATVIAFTGSYIAPYDPFETRLEIALQGPTAQHWFGMDNLGRDVFSRTVIGTRVSLYVGLTTMLMATAIGLFLGVSSAYLGGKYDLIVQRFIDGIVAIPSLLLALTLVAAFEIGMENVIIALTIVNTPRITRVVRSSALTIMAMPYIEAARTIGSSNFRIMLRHIAPNTFAPLVVVASAAVGSIITAESSLSFLGLGVPYDTLSWGGLLGGDTRQLFVSAPWMAFGPGVSLTLVVFGSAIFADALRDVFDPKLRGR